MTIMKKYVFTLFLSLAVGIVSAAKVHIIGDSMSSIYGDQSNQASANADYTAGMRGWGQFFGEYINGMTVQDWAHTGCTAKGFYSSANYWKAVMGETDYASSGYQTYLQERPYVSGFTAVAAGDYVIITFGHNDQKGGSTHNGYKTVTESEYLTYLTLMVNEVKAHGAYPILGTSICRSLWSGTTLTALGKIDAGEAAGEAGNVEYNYPAKARALAATLQIPCLDMNLGSQTIWEACGKSITGSVFFPAGGTTHTSEAGAKAICAWVNNAIAAWGNDAMNGATLSNYQPLITAMKSGIAIPQKSDFTGQEAVVTEETLWTFDTDLEDNAYTAGAVVTSELQNRNGLYLRGFTNSTTVRSFTTVANTQQVQFTDANSTTITPNFQITTTNVLGDGKATETSICPETAGAAVTDGTSRCVAINTAGPGTFYVAMRSNGNAASGRVFNLAFNGEIKATAATSKDITELKWHAETAGVFCAWATQSYNIAAVLYVPDADDSEDRLHEDDPETPVVTPTRVPVIITAGQSNTDGRCTQETQPSYLSAAIGETGMSRVLWSYGNSSGWSWTGGAGQFAPFIPRSESSSPGRWAYDAVAYYYLTEAMDAAHNLYVIKESAGGTSIAPGSTSSGDRHWSVDAEWLSTHGYVGDGNGGTALSPALRYNIEQCVNTLVADNKIPDFRAIFWHQGESDRTPSASAAAYYDNLKAVIAYFRQSVTTVMNTKYSVSTYDYSTLPFILGTVSKSSSLYNATIEQAMIRIAAEDANVYLIDMQDGTMLSDQKHFDAASAELFGKRLYNKVCDLNLLSEYGVTAEDRLGDIQDAQAVVDFGSESVVGEATTWTFNTYAADAVIASQLTDYNGLYLRATSGNGHTVTAKIANTKGYTLTFGDGEGVQITMGAYTSGLDWSPAITAGAAVTTANDRCYAVNVRYPGTFRCFVAPKDATSGRSVKLWFNGEQVGTATYVAEGSHATELVFTATTAGTFYITADIAYYLYAAKYTPSGMHTMNVTSIGWASLYLPFDAELPEGMTAYYAASAESNTITLRQLDGSVPSCTGVLVKAASGSYTLSACTEDAELLPENANLFEGVTVATACEANANYVLSGESTATNPVFDLYTGTSLDAYKAYLPAGRVPSADGAPIRFVIEGQQEPGVTTDVAAPAYPEQVTKVIRNGQLYILRSGMYYSISGQRIQ